MQDLWARVAAHEVIAELEACEERLATAEGLLREVYRDRTGEDAGYKHGSIYARLCLCVTCEDARTFLSVSGPEEETK